MMYYDVVDGSFALFLHNTSLHVRHARRHHISYITRLAGLQDALCFFNPPIYPHYPAILSNIEYSNLIDRFRATFQRLPAA